MLVSNTSDFLQQALDTEKKDTGSVTTLLDNGIENALLNCSSNNLQIIFCHYLLPLSKYNGPISCLVILKNFRHDNE